MICAEVEQQLKNTHYETRATGVQGVLVVYSIKEAMAVKADAGMTRTLSGVSDE